MVANQNFRQPSGTVSIRGSMRLTSINILRQSRWPDGATVSGIWSMFKITKPAILLDAVVVRAYTISSRAIRTSVVDALDVCCLEYYY